MINRFFRISVPCALSITLLGIQSAFSITLPFTFSAGGAISASQINLNFQTLATTSWSLDGSNVFFNSGFVGAGTTNPSSTLQTGGSFGVATKTVTSAYTLTSSDQTLFVNASAGAFTVTLPAVVAGRMYTIKKIDISANTVTIATPSGVTIDSASSALLKSPSAYVNISSDGTNYWITGSNTLIATGMTLNTSITLTSTTSWYTMSHSANGLNVTATQSGNYLVWYSTRAYAADGGNQSISWSFQLYDTTNGIIDTAWGNNANYNSGSQASAMTTNGDNRVTKLYLGYLTAGHVYTVLQAFRSYGSSVTTYASDGSGGPSIHMVKVY